ncbi:hypothetical protein BX070DRAFT_219185 [Coemansia spiralis]|nr:hypothetical protein BX070DRAFT_219185 [Coemansia spiralis]
MDHALHDKKLSSGNVFSLLFSELVDDDKMSVTVWLVKREEPYPLAYLLCFAKLIACTQK